MRKYILFILILLSLKSLSQVNEIFDEEAIDKSDLKFYVKFLSSSTFKGRLTGTAGQKKSAKFIADRFKTLGLKPFNESYYQKIKLIQSYWGEVYLKVKNRRLLNFEEMVFLGHNNQNDEVEKEIIFGGNGEEDQLNQIDVKDKVVLVFINNLMASYEINRRLKKRNAFAVIFANPGNSKQFESTKRIFEEHLLRIRLYFADYDTNRQDTVSIINEFIIPNEHVKKIMGLSIRSLEKSIANNSIKNVPVSTIRLKCERIFETIVTENVIGVLEGTSRESIVVSAHYDHLGSSRNGYFPGADDNASGVAALIELAEAFSGAKELYYSLIFLAVTGEEEGLLGSKYFVRSKGFNPDSVYVNLNMDMIGRIDKGQNKKTNYLYCIGTDIFPHFNDFLVYADNTFKDCTFDFSLNNSKDLTGVYQRSDQYSFYQKKVPALMFFSGFHGDYHKQSDSWAKIDYALLQNRVRLIGTVINIIQNN